jgi:tRNA nucleotidyltransferase (CCA-adding enzyme)
MEFKLPEIVKNILNKFTEANYQIYIVGGPVRDLLMGKEPKDWDFTTDAKPEEILKLFPEGFYNNQFGTVGIPRRDSDLHPPSSILEITTMRKEGEYSDSRHPDEVSWTDKIEEDLARRDFTINAMALSASVIASDQAKQSQGLVDPFNGQSDLESKLIKAVGDPTKRFQEDALRLMRAIRFATQLQFIIEPNTFKAIQENSGLIQNISWERIRDELFKTLATDFPYEGVVLLRTSGLLKYILPEIEKCFGIVQEGPKHDRIYDIGEHSLLSLKECPSKDPLVRFATLIHDVGKPDTMNIQENGNVTFYGHDVVGGRVAKKICERLKLSNKQIEKVVTLVRFHMFTLDENQTDSAIRRFITNIGFENVDDMMDLRVGDRLGGGTEIAVSWRMEEFRKRIDQVMEKPFSVTDLKVNGQDVMEVLQISPSRKVGEILDTLFQEVVEDDSKNNREYLLERIRKI